MSLARQLDAYIKETGQEVFIEVEGKPDKILKFIAKYNETYGTDISMDTDGVLVLKPNANKWSLEYRLYMQEKDGAPEGLNIGPNHEYRMGYAYRINDMDLIWDLFDLGYSIGLN